MTCPYINNTCNIKDAPNCKNDYSICLVVRNMNEIPVITENVEIWNKLIIQKHICHYYADWTVIW